MIRNAAVALLLLLPGAGLARTAEPMPPQLVGTYDTANPFARIIRGELPVAKVYEDRHVLAFMDNHPAAPGHVLVISKTSHARNFLEVSPRDLARIMAVVQRIVRAEFVALNPDGITIVQNNGSAQTVFHLHVHIIPRVKNTSFPEGSKDAVDAATLAPIAAKIAAALK
jgi:histidine triad (HIT) family protein